MKALPVGADSQLQVISMWKEIPFFSVFIQKILKLVYWFRLNHFRRQTVEYEGDLRKQKSHKWKKKIESKIEEE